MPFCPGKTGEGERALSLIDIEMHNLYKFIKEIVLLAKRSGYVFAFKYVLLTLYSLPDVLALGSLSPVDKRIKGLLTVKSHGFAFKFLPEAISVVRELHYHDCYGFDTARKYDTIIDLGANCGTFTALAAKVARRVISVECNTADMPGRFTKTMELNSINNAVFVNKFAASSDSVSNVSINTLTQNFNIRAIDYFKVDIEGAETDLFSSNLEWLKITNQVSMEVHPCFGVDEIALIRILTVHGFTVTLLDKNYSLVPCLPRNSMGYIRARKA